MDQFFDDDIDKWNASSGRMAGSKESTKILNAYLDTLQTKVYDALRFLVDRDEIVTAEKIKNKLTGNRERPKKILMTDEFKRWLICARKKADWYDPFVDVKDKLLKHVEKDETTFEETDPVFETNNFFEPNHWRSRSFYRR